MQPATELGRVELEKYIDALLRYSNEVLTAEERQTALNEALNAGASAAAIATGEMLIKQEQIKQEKLKGNENAALDMALAEGKLTKADHDRLVQMREETKELRRTNARKKRTPWRKNEQPNRQKARRNRRRNRRNANLNSFRNAGKV